MTTWRETILDFIYPQNPQCILCGQPRAEQDTGVCRPCYLELIWNPTSFDSDARIDWDRSGGFPGRADVCIRRVSSAEGRMKQLLKILDNDPDDAAVDLAACLLVSRAGAWLQMVSALAPMPAADQDGAGRLLDHSLVREVSVRTRIPIMRPHSSEHSVQNEFQELTRTNIPQARQEHTKGGVLIITAHVNNLTHLPHSCGNLVYKDRVRILALA